MRTPTARRYDLDWLRVIATGLVFIFHSHRFFDLGKWHVKNAETSILSEAYIAALAQVIMPLFFVLSGISAYYALGSQQGRFLLERSKRLLIPLVFGILVLAPPQIYLDRLTFHLFGGSFLDFLPHYFEGFWMGEGTPGNFAWMGVHLWYLLFMFLYSLALLPVFVLLRGEGRREFASRFARFLARPGMVYLPVLLLIPAQIATGLEIGGWDVAVYFLLFFYGYLFLVDEGIGAALARQRRLHLAAGLLLWPVTLWLYYVYETGPQNDFLFVALGVTHPLQMWAFVLGALGMAAVHLNFSNRFLAYANEAVLPFYMLHQPVILIVGFNLVVGLSLPILAKYFLVMAIALPAILGLYELLVRRVGVLRFLFGLKPIKRTLPLPQGKQSQTA